VQEEKKEEQQQETQEQAVNTEAGTPVVPEIPVEIKEPTPEDLIREKDCVIKDLNDKYLRALAEQDNYRKRVAKDKEDFVKYSRSEAVLAFLPVLDNFERAIHSTDKNNDFGKLKNGIDMVIKQFEGKLKEMGVKEVPASGIFDPNLHHVLLKEHADGKKEGEILEVFQKGFMLDDKIIRPATVKVAHNEAVKKEENGHKNHDHKETNHNHNQNHDHKK
jgi:molecular chaperone GrpE